MQRQAARLGLGGEIAPARLEGREAEDFRMRKGLCLVGQCEDATEHFVRAESVRDLLVLQDAQSRRRVERVHRVYARAASEKAEQARHSERAAEGQHGEQ